MFRLKHVSWAVMAVCTGGLATVAVAQQQQLERVEITGSSIRRVDAETALPVTVIKTEDLVKQGVTNVEQAVLRISANQSNFGASSAIGGTTGGKAEADLRGLSGPTGTNSNKTLVLLNGRRIANHSFDAAAVDLNAIPLIAVERIEVLRDGASALYGTDAIGGVINFILKRDFTGVELSGSWQRPQKGSGGETQRASVVAGFGTLAENRFNLLFALDARKQKALMATERSFGSTGILGTSGAAIRAGTSGTSFPGDLNGFEPTAPGCAPPASVPVTNTDGSISCRYDFSRDVDLLTENEQLTGLLRGTLAITPDHKITAEYMRANNKSTARVAAAPTSHLMLASSPFFPAGATPVDIDPLIPFFGLTDPNPGGPTMGGTANWRQVPAGKRTSGDDTTTERMVIDAEGTIGSFDYRAGIGRSQNKSVASVKRGYVNDGIMQQGVWDGIINPFGPQTAAGQALIDSAQVVADTVIGKNTLDFADFRVSGELFKLGDHMVSAAFGAEHRREQSTFENTDITAQLGSLGLDPNGDTSGKRDVNALFAEFNIPVLKNLELTLAGRYDKYSDFGNTFNPKVGIRFQPTPQLVIRGSANKGFRAPTLYEIYQPQALTFTTDNYDDPILCPGGNAVAGTSPGVVCGQQVMQRLLGPVANGQSAGALSPEKSMSYSLGLVFEPMRNVSVSVDYWQVQIKNMISPLPEQEVFASAGRYASRFVRCSQVAAGQVPGISLSDIDACANLTATQDPIAFIDTPNENLGELHTRGVDVSASWRSGASEYGVFGLGIDGTYITRYKYQREKGGAFIDAVGAYSDNAPVFRWQHTLTATWNQGPWGATLSQRHKSHYEDQGAAGKVGVYAIWDASVSWTGIKNMVLTAGVNNLMDKDPPRSVQVTTFQRGYDPRFTDPLGRTFLVRAAYKF
jgi:iron complex outermembrane receptor protein